MITNLGELKEINQNISNITNESILVTENINNINISNLVTFKKIYNNDVSGTPELGLYDAFGNIIARIKNILTDYTFQPFDYRIGLKPDNNEQLFEVGNLYKQELDLGINTNNTFIKYEETFFQDSIKYYYCNSIPRLNMNLRVLPFLNYDSERINFIKNANVINNTSSIKPNTDIFLILEKDNDRKVIKNTLKNKFKYIINKDAEYSLISSNQFDTNIQRFSEFEGSKTIKESIIVKTKDNYTMVSILDYKSLMDRVYKYTTSVYDNYIDFDNKGTLIYSKTNYERFFDFCIEEDKLILIGLNLRPKSDYFDALELIKKTVILSTKVEQVKSYSNYKKDDNYINNLNLKSINYDIMNTINTLNHLNNIIDINFNINKNALDENISQDLIQIYFNTESYHEVLYLVAKDDYFYLNSYFNYNNTGISRNYTYEKLKIKYYNLDNNDVFITVFPEEVLTDKGISNFPRIDHYHTKYVNYNIDLTRSSYELDINPIAAPLKDFDVIVDISFSIIPLYKEEDYDSYDNNDKIALDIIYRTKNSSLIKHEVIVLGYTEFSSSNIQELYEPFYKITKKVSFIKFQDNYIIREDLINKTMNLEMFKGSFINIIKEADELLEEVVYNTNTSINILKGWLRSNIEDYLNDGYEIKYIVEAPNFIFKHSHDYGNNLYDITTRDYKLPVQYDFDITQTQIVPDTSSNYKQLYLNCHFYFTNANVNNKLNDKINCSLIGNIKNKYNFMDMFFELQTYNVLIPEGSTSIPDDSIIIDELTIDNFVILE